MDFVLVQPLRLAGVYIEKPNNVKNMTDSQFQKALDRLSMAKLKYHKLLAEAEDEVVRRYGVHPSDCDNDLWIDNFHVGCGKMTVDEVRYSMEQYSNVSPLSQPEKK